MKKDRKIVEEIGSRSRLAMRKAEGIFITLLMVFAFLYFVNIGSNAGEEWIPSIPESPSGTVHDVKMKSSDSTGLTVDVDIPGIYAANITVNDTVFQIVEMPFVGYTSDVGMPRLPAIRRYLEVPLGVVLSAETTYSDYKTLDGYYVYPAQEPLPDNGTNIIPEFVLNEDLYSSNNFYPSDEVDIGEPMMLRGHRIALLIVFPVQFNPVTGQIRLYSKIEVRINYDHPAQIGRIEERLLSDAFEVMAKAIILNYKSGYDEQTKRTRDLGGTRGTGVDYLIITDDTFSNEVQPLADWKEKKGLRTKVVTTSEICTNADPDDDATEIEQYIQDAYDTWDPPPTYVLLVGDSEYLPTNYRTNHPSHGTLIGTDLYYGTVDGSDHFADIFMGRISVDTTAQASTVIDKILNYEKNPPADADFYSDISVSAYFQDDDDINTPDYDERDGFEDRRFVLTSEEIRDYLLTQNYNVERIYFALPAVDPTNYGYAYDLGLPLPADLLRANGFAWSGSGLDIVNAINAGRFMINHRDHGSTQGWSHPSFTVGDLPQLNNSNELPVVFSIDCQVGWFDAETDQHAWNLESFSEELLRLGNGGAVATIAATRNSYSGFNDDLYKGFIDAIWSGFDPTMETAGLFELGQVLIYGKVYMTAFRGTSNAELRQSEEYHLFGDPSMSILTEQPSSLTVTHPPMIGSEGTQNFMVKVTDGNAPIHNAMVSLLKGSDVHMLGYTDPDGIVRFEVTPSTGGDMYVTVTCHNCNPYEGNIVVTDNGAQISLSSDVGPSGMSITMTGSDFNNGETIEVNFGTIVVSANPSTVSNGALDTTIVVPEGYEGPTNIVVTGQDSNRAATAVFRVMPEQYLPDPYIYSQWDSSTWHLDPSGDRVWDNPVIQLYEDNNPVSSRELYIGTTYTVKATIHNSVTEAADGTTVTFKWTNFGSGQQVWHDMGSDTIDVPASPGTAEATVEWTPIHNSHTCIKAKISHPWDSNLDNNEGQENTDVRPISSPGVVDFTVENPTDETALAYLEVTQEIVGGETEGIWYSKIEREYPQILEPGENQTATITVYAPVDARIGDKRNFTVTASIDGEIIGGVEFTLVVDHQPVLSEPEITPEPVEAEKTVTFRVKYTDEDNHPPLAGYPKVSIFKGGTPITGSPFTMVAEDQGDANYADGKIYEFSTSLSEAGEDYTYFFYAMDQLGVNANGSATSFMDGPLVEEETKDEGLLGLGPIMDYVVLLVIVLVIVVTLMLVARWRRRLKGSEVEAEEEVEGKE